MKTITLKKEVTLKDESWIYNQVNLKELQIGSDKDQQKIKCLWIRQSGITLGLADKHNNRMLQINNDPSMFAIANFSEFKLKDQPMSVTSDYILRFLKTGITINRRTYRFFGCSNSQLRSKTCYLYAAEFPQITKIINSMGNFSNINSVAKKMKRIGLLFTSTHVGIELQPKEYEDIEDVEGTNGDIFTDGCGFISQKFARFIATKMNIRFRNKKYIPSVFQIRYKGYKGVVMQSNALKGFFKVQFRKSMKKFNGCEDKCFSAANYSMAYTFGNLNAELITLLSALGIGDEVFKKKQTEYFEFIRNTTLDIASAFEFCCYKNEILLAEQILNGGLTPNIQQKLKKLQSVEWNKILSGEKNCDSDKIKKKIRIFIPESRLLFGVCDPTGQLKEGEVFVRITVDGSIKTIEGAEIIASRNPCLHPGDIQKFKAVDIRELHYLCDVIVFPVVGARPAASLLSGGDLDGDKFFVCWDKELIPKTLFEPYGYPPAKLVIQRDINHEKLIEYFVRWNNSSLGKIKNLYLDWCRSSLDGAAAEECQELNALFSSAVDAEKVVIPDKLLNPPVNPDRSFIVDVLLDNFKIESSIRMQSDPELIPFFPEDNIEMLLKSDVDTLSEFDVFKLIHDVCIRNGIDITNHLHHFNFDKFSDMEKRWTIQMLKDVDNFSDLILNSLNQSAILTSQELSNHKLHSSVNHWKRLYSSLDDDGRRFATTLTQCMSEFKRKLIVFKVNDLLKIAIYIPIVLDFLPEEPHDVDDAFKVFSFTKGSGNFVRDTVKDYKLEFNEHVFQLYKTKKTDNTLIFFQMKRNRFSDKIDVNVSIALEKLHDSVQRRVGKVKSVPSELVEIYVISHRDKVGHQLLDISMNEVKTDNVRKCVENIPKEFIPRKLEDIEFGKYPDVYKKILLEKEFDLLEDLTDIKEILELCYETNSKYILILMINYILENSEKIENYQQFLNLILNLIQRLPYIAVEVTEFLGKKSTSHLQCAEYIKLLRGLINYSNELPSLCSANTDLILTILRDKSEKFSWDDVIGLTQAIVFSIRNKSTAIEYLQIILDDFKDLYSDNDENCIEYFRKSIMAICVNYLAEVDDKTEIDGLSIPICKKKDILSRNVKSTNKSGIYEAEIRLDCQYKPKNNDHIRFICAKELLDKPIAFDAIVQSVKKGSFTFKIQQEEPYILLQASWYLTPCSETTTLMAMFESISKLMTKKKDSTSEFSTIVLNNPDSNSRDLISNSALKFYSKTLNNSQKEAIKMALSNSLTLIWGPPGTGKTTVVVEMILQLNSTFEDIQILICASTHNAVDNILEKFLTQNEITNVNFNDEDVIRVATEVCKVKSSLQKYTIDAFVGKNIHDNNKAKKEAKGKIKKAKFIFTTCTGAGLGLLREEKFEIVIIDEASQLTEPNCLIPIVNGSKKIIMVGDHVQLRPTVTLDAEVYNLQLSLFERLYTSSSVVKTMLNTQYRMNPLLANIASEMSYNGALLSGVSEEERQPCKSNFKWPEIDGGNKFPAVFVDCLSDESTFSKSKSNEGQAKCVVDIVRKLRIVDAFSIAILSPYDKQVKMIEGLLGSKRGLIEVKTIDGFQGREADVVIVSTVRKNDSFSLGFCDDPRRINVALTRAKVGLIVVGHRVTLESSDLWKKYLNKLKKVDFKK